MRAEPIYKRPLDLCILLGAHVVLLPLWLILWTTIPLAIWLESGRPIFYVSEKMGMAGRPFRMWKFRSMVRDADKVGPPITSPSDPRVTRVGAFLRKTALDELPQLLAILSGDMSFVGPRPYGRRSHEMYQELDHRFERRLQVKPGLTGLAAVYGDPADPGHRLGLDLLYVRERSLWLDLKLLFASLWIALSMGWERKQEPGKLPPTDLVSADCDGIPPSGADLGRVSASGEQRSPGFGEH